MDDFALALQLQAEFDQEAATSRSESPVLGSLGDNTSTPLSLVDERWENLDPNPDIRALFLEFNDKYFWGKLSGIEVKWSPRMTLCAGLCVYEGRGGLCSVRLSTPLLKLRPRKDLIETLLHEMIHAYLFVTDNNKDHDGHGPEFHKHMYRLNKKTGTNISVYHNFHDEVENYRQHWWKCDGPCQHKPPYFGFVRRAMNRAPAPRDPWWADHQRTCGGTYRKVKEPEGYGEKKGGTKKTEEKKKLEKPKGSMDIRNFGSKAKIVGGVLQWPKDPSPSTSTKVPPNTSKITNGDTAQSSSGVVKPTWKPAPVETKPSPEVNTDDKKAQHFQGSGKALGGVLSNNGSDPSRIVRRIPGFGLISCERPQSEQHKESSKVPNELSSASVEDNTSVLPKSPSGKSSDLLEVDSSDDDLFVLTKPLKSRKKHDTSGSSSGSFHNGTATSELPVGHSRKVPGFRSVSSQGAGSRKDDFSQINKRKKPSVAASKTKVRKVVREISAADRNRRAHYITSSESEEDFDEKMTLGNAVKNKQKTVVLGSDTDSDAGATPRLGAHVIETKNIEAPPTSGHSVDNSQVAVSLCDCPVCGASVPANSINEHLDSCLQ